MRKFPSINDNKWNLRLTDVVANTKKEKQNIILNNLC